MRRLHHIYIKPVLVMCLVWLCVEAPRAQTKTEMFTGVVTVGAVELTEHADSLLLKMELRVSGKAIGKRQSWAIIPQLAGNEADSLKRIAFPYALVNGHIREQQYQRKLKFGNEELLSNLPGLKTEIPRRGAAAGDVLLHYAAHLPYEQWMDTAGLLLHVVLVSPAGERQLLTVANAGRVKLAPHTCYEVKPCANFVEPVYGQKQTHLDFRAGNSEILFRSNQNLDEVAEMAHAILKINSDPDAKPALFIVGYASPEGKYEANARISHQRAQALADYMAKLYGLNKEMFRISAVAEDWDGLADLVEASTIGEREEVLKIIRKVGIFEGREVALMQLDGGRVYQKLKTAFFPQLRRAECRIAFPTKDGTTEFYRQAMDCPPGSKQREQMFELIGWLYPDDPATAINAAAMMIDRGEYSEAKRLLEPIRNNPAASNNMGICLLMEGELDMAEEYLEKAADGGVREGTHNLKELRNKRADNEKMKRYQID